MLLDPTPHTKMGKIKTHTLSWCKILDDGHFHPIVGMCIPISYKMLETKGYKRAGVEEKIHSYFRNLLLCVFVCRCCCHCHQLQNLLPLLLAFPWPRNFWCSFCWLSNSVTSGTVVAGCRMPLRLPLSQQLPWLMLLKMWGMGIEQEFDRAIAVTSGYNSLCVLSKI